MRERGVWVLAVLVAVLAAWTTVQETHRWHKAPFGDFNYLQTGGQCLLAGCNPYDYLALNREAARRGGNKPEIWPMTPVYPASTLLLLLPFAGLHWPLAAYVFDGLAGLAAAAAGVLMVWWPRVRVWDPAALILIAVLVCRPMAAALEFGNPALVEAGLMTLACLLLLESSYLSAGWFVLGLALALKPQMAVGAVLVLFCRRESRGAALKACGLALGLLLAGVLAYRIRLGSFQFLGTLRWVLWLTSLPGATSDYLNKESSDFLNLQTAIGALPHLSRGMVNGLTWLTVAALTVATAWLAAKHAALRRMPWTLIALATAIALLPVYHRGYDRMIALLLAPAARELARESRRLAWLYAALVTLWVANDTVMAHVLKRWRYAPQNGLEDVLFCAVLLLALAWLPRDQAPALGSIEA
jgi:hypothetical protein